MSEREREREFDAERGLAHATIACHSFHCFWVRSIFSSRNTISVQTSVFNFINDGLPCEYGLWLIEIDDIFPWLFCRNAMMNANVSIVQETDLQRRQHATLPYVVHRPILFYHFNGNVSVALRCECHLGCVFLTFSDIANTF